MQVDPRVDPARFRRLEPKYNEPVSNVALSGFNLRPCVQVPKERWPEAAGEYWTVGVTDSVVALAREMESAIVGSVVEPLMGPGYVSRWAVMQP